MKPGAKHEAIVERDGAFELHVKAPATEGRANEAAIELLARALGIAKSLVMLRHGEQSRSKVFAVESLSAQAIDERLRAFAR